MASRLALDLGLHFDGTLQVQAGTMTVDVARARRATFHGTYIIDQQVLCKTSEVLGAKCEIQIMDLLLGKAFTSDSHLNISFRVSARPAARRQRSLESRQRDASPHQRADAAFSACSTERLADNALFGNFLTGTKIVCLSFSLIMCSTDRRFRYGPERISNDELQQSAEKTFNGMLRWKASLPLQLRFDPDSYCDTPTPHVLLLQ
jgi:hypothetical protein